MASAIVAVDKNWGIGKDNKLLCHITEDMKHFKEITNDKIVIMGRKTWDSLPNKPLPYRSNIVITHNPQNMEKLTLDENDFMESTEAYAMTLKALITLLKINKDDDDFIVIGGGTIYKKLLKYCNKVYVTQIFESFEADTYFPNLHISNKWEVTEKSEAKEHNGIYYRFLTYERRKRFWKKWF